MTTNQNRDEVRERNAELVALEAKLAKARRLKQGVMQQLLTGRIGNAGFQPA